MITMTASVQLLGDKNEKITQIVQTSPDTSVGLRQQNNVSAEIGAVINKKQRSKSLFFLSDKILTKKLTASVLDGSSTYSPKSVSYYIGGHPTGENDLVTFPTVFEVSTEDGGISGLGIDFDIQNGQYPPEITVKCWDSTTNDWGESFTVQDNDAEYHFVFAETSKVQVTISKWNKRGFPIVITGIYASLSLDLDYRSLRSVSHKIIDRGDIELPSYGIMSNSGSFEFKDIDNQIQEYIEERLLRANMQVEFFINNTTTKITQKIGEARTNKWNYNVSNYVVSVSLKDDIEEWQNIQIDKQSYYIYSEITTMLDVYNSLKSITPTKYRFASLSTDVSTYLSNIKLGYTARLESGSLWSAWDKFGKANALHIFKNKQGEVAITL